MGNMRIGTHIAVATMKLSKGPWWMTTVRITFWFVCFMPTSKPTEIPGLEHTAYVREGDILLGGLFKLQEPSSHGYCSPIEDSTKLPYTVQMAEMMNYAISEVNGRNDILPNISIGFVIMDTCATDVTALARATFFVGETTCEQADVVDQPRTWRKSRNTLTVEEIDLTTVLQPGLVDGTSAKTVSTPGMPTTFNDQLLNSSESSSTATSETMKSVDPTYESTTELANDSKRPSPAFEVSNRSSTTDSFPQQQQQQQQLHHKVVGIIGPDSSRESVMVSSFLGLYQVPTLSMTATSDDLSDKERYKYFSRLVPSDSHQVEMFVELLLLHNWTYVSLLYSEGSYGENAAKKTERATEANEICIAYQKRIPRWANAVDYDKIATDLKNSHARVIITFVAIEMAVPLFAAFSRLDSLQYFFWLCGDFLAYVPEPIPGLSGAIYASGVIRPVPGFGEYFGSLAPWKVPDNPWMREAWSQQFNCVWLDNGDDDDDSHDHKTNSNLTRSCMEYDKISDWAAFKGVELKTSKVYEGVQVYALALHALISDECPEAFKNKSILHSCIRGDQLLAQIRNVSFGYVHFDSIGDLQPVFDISQVFYENDGTYHIDYIGRWDKKVGLSFESDIQFQWMTGSGNFTQGIPESVCSRPCKPKEYAFQMELRCCWECRRCRTNEIIVNESRCESCPQFSWPDNATQTLCEIIDATYLQPNDVFGLGLLALSSIGIFLSLVSSALFIHYRDHKLVKASSRELNSVTVLGIFCAFSGVLAFVTQPTWLVCWSRITLFSVAVNMIFSPILIKTVRIYRLFRAGRKGKTRPKFTSSSLQVALTAVLISVQVLLVVVINQQSPPTARSHMPVSTEKYVELICEQSLAGFILPMVYNILVVLVCAMLGFLTRKLPENFNESWFIFVSVATTLFMWLLFVPSYYNAFYAYHQAALLALCLIVNAYVTLTCLILSKVYAVIFVRETNMKISTMVNPPSTRRDTLEIVNIATPAVTASTSQ